VSVVYRTGLDSDRLEMWALLRLMANQGNFNRWTVDPRIMITLLRGKEILVGTEMPSFACGSKAWTS